MTKLTILKGNWLFTIGPYTHWTTCDRTPSYLELWYFWASSVGDKITCFLCLDHNNTPSIKEFFFYLTLYAKKISNLTSYQIYFLKWPIFNFWSFSSFPPFETAGMSPLSDTCQIVTSCCRFDFFFYLFFIPAN